MAQPSITSSMIVANSFYAGGTTNPPFSRNSAGTVLPDAGVVYAAASIRAPKIVGITSITGGAISGTTLTGTGAISGTTVAASTGFVFAGSVNKKFSCGTYYGVGGATAPLQATSLTTITHVFMQLNKASYSTATTGLTWTRPCVAAGTTGSFYPIAFKMAAGGAVALNTVAGTFRWVALGA